MSNNYNKSLAASGSAKQPQAASASKDDAWAGMAADAPAAPAPATVADAHAPAPAADDSAALKQQIAALKEENKALRENETLGSETGSFPRSDRSTSTKPTYMFRVTAVNKPDLKPMDIRAVDEGEAIRLFALRSMPGKVLDTVDVRWKVDCQEAQKRKQDAVAAHKARMAAMGFADETVLTPVGT